MTTPLRFSRDLDELDRLAGDTLPPPETDDEWGDELSRLAAAPPASSRERATSPAASATPRAPAPFDYAALQRQTAEMVRERTPAPSLRDLNTTPRVRSDVTRVAPDERAARPPLPVRAAQGVAGFVRQAVSDPLGTAAQIITDPVRSAVRALNTPVAGERVSAARAQRGKAGPLRGALREGERITKENTPGAITEREFREAAAQTVANVAAGPIFANVRRATRPILGRTGSAAAAGAASGIPAGAAYSPDDPLAGGLAAALIGGGIGAGAPAAARGAGKGARAVGRAVRHGFDATARGFRTARRRAAETIDPSIGDELSQLAEVREQRDIARRAAEHDELTGMGNRAAYERAKPAAEADPGVSFVMADVNGLKGLNDALGHAAGDDALAQIKSSVDRAWNDVGLTGDARSFRIGGDEVAVLVPTEKAEAYRVALEKRYGVRDHGQGVKTSLSAGVGENAAVADAESYVRKRQQKREQGIPDRSAAAPGEVVQMRLRDIDVEPERFQFRSAVDPKTGTGAELKGVQRFNRDLAGVAAVWIDPKDGRAKMVNGHHRYELALRTGGPDFPLDVRVIEAPTAEAAGAKGALINIAEGRATAVDAAKWFRDTETGLDALEAQGVSLRSGLVREGMALAKLAPDLFDRVARGEIEQAHGVAIGMILDSPAQQRAVLELMQRKGARLSAGQVGELARIVRDSGEASVTQETLFGKEETSLSLAVEKARLIDALKTDLARDKRLFGFVTREGRAGALARAGNVIDVERSAALAQESAVITELFDRLATRSGPLAPILNDAARRLANGDRLQAVKADIAAAVRETLSEALTGGQGGRAQPGQDDVPSRGTQAGDAGGADAGPDLEGRARDSVDPDQGAMLAPARRGRPTARPRDELDALADPAGAPDEDLFGTRRPSDAPTQGALFGGKEGTAAARSLSQARAAAAGELDLLRQRLALEGDAKARQQLAARIAELERIVHYDRAISPEEIAARAAGERAPTTPDTGPDQIAMFSPAASPTKIGAVVQKALGIRRPNTERIKSLTEISRNLAAALNVPLRQGRFNAKLMRALGAFFPHSEVIRVRALKKLDTVAHETGHYISKHYLRNPTMGGSAARGAQRLTPQVKRELVQLGRDLYGDRQPNAGYGEEGLAQVARFYVTDRPRLLADAPAVAAWWDTVLAREPALRGILDQAHDDYQAHIASPASAQIDASISVGEQARTRPRVKDFIRLIVDDLDEFREITEALEKPRSAAGNAYIAARLTRGNAGRALDMIQRGATDFQSRARVSRGLAEILTEVGEDNFQDFRRYLVSRETMTKHAQGLDMGPRVEAAAAVVAAGDARWGKLAQDYWAYRDALLKYRRDAGLLTEAEYQTIRANNPTPTPFFRVFDPNETAMGQGFGRQLGRNTSGVFRKRGSSRPIIDPLESVVRETYQVVSQAQRHHVAQMLVKQALRTEGGGRWIELLPEVPKERIAINLPRVREQLADLGYKVADDLTPAELTALEDAMLVDFREKTRGGAAEAKDLIMPVLIGGDRRWIQIVDRDLWNALQGLNEQELGIVERAFAVPNTWLRRGAVLSPEFQGANPLRDMLATAIYSQGPTRPPGWHFAKGAFHLLKKGALYERWAQEGGLYAGMSGADRKAVQATLRDIAEGRMERVHKRLASSLANPAEAATWMARHPHRALHRLHPIDALAHVAEFMENANRLGEFIEVRQAAMRKGAGEIPASIEGAYASRELIDFAKLGTVSRTLNRIIAFFGPAIVDLSKFYREHHPSNLTTAAGRARMGKVVARATAAITLPSLYLYLTQRDDPDYRDIPEHWKATGWVIIDREGDGSGSFSVKSDSGKIIHIYWIPRPHLLGFAYGYVPEKVLEAIDRDNPKALSELAAQSWNVVVPPVVPTAIRPLWEIARNRAFLGDRPIVPEPAKGLPPSEQSGRYTGEAARALGRAAEKVVPGGVSPAKIEHLYEGYTGGLGRYGRELIADKAVRELREAQGKRPLAPEKLQPRDPLDRTPVLRRFIVPPPGAGSKSVRAIFDDFAAAESKRAKWRKLVKEGKQDEARRYLNQHRAEILAVFTAEEGGGRPGPLRAHHDALYELSRARNALATHPMAPAERAQRLDGIESRMTQLARRYYDRASSLSRGAP